MCPPTSFSDHRISASRKICSVPQKRLFRQHRPNSDSTRAGTARIDYARAVEAAPQRPASEKPSSGRSQGTCHSRFDRQAEGVQPLLAAKVFAATTPSRSPIPKPSEFALFDNLDLRLAVNGVVRQDDMTAGSCALSGVTKSRRVAVGASTARGRQTRTMLDPPGEVARGTRAAVDSSVPDGNEGLSAVCYHFATQLGSTA
jgi:hypothetical protein